MHKLIACVDSKFGIAKNEKIPWAFKDDLKFFREKTMNQTVVMGTKTMLSLPNRFLDNRENCVISSKLGPAKNCKVFKSINDFLNTYDDFWVIGGAEIYNAFLALDQVDYALITFIKQDYAADIFLDQKYLAKFTKKIVFDSAKYSILEYSRIN